MAVPGPIVQGKDFNYYNKITVTSTSFPSEPQVIFPFVTQSIIILNEGSGSTNVVEYSFNGTPDNVNYRGCHGELDPTLPSRGLVFDSRTVSAIWFRLKTGSSGSVSVRVEAWAKP